MEFFDKIGKKATEAYKVTADKTGKIARETKIKFKIGELKTQINDIYEEIGKKVYEKHTREEEVYIKKDLEEQCTKIDTLSNEIESLSKECLALKDKKQCPNCYKELEKSSKFCPNCGTQQSEQVEEKITEEVREEILENLQDSETDISKTNINENIEDATQNNTSDSYSNE